MHDNVRTLRVLPMASKLRLRKVDFLIVCYTYIFFTLVTLMSQDNKQQFTFVTGGSEGADTGAILAGEKASLPVIGYIKVKDGKSETTAEMQKKYTKLFTVDSNPKKDQANVGLCDFLVAFRLNRPRTGKGTDQTINYALCGKYEFEDGKIKYANEYKDKIHVIETGKKPVVVIWDVSKDNLVEFAKQTRAVVDKHSAKQIMVSGPIQDTYACDELVRDFLVELTK
jgi:hypothetical protein